MIENKFVSAETFNDVNSTTLDSIVVKGRSDSKFRIDYTPSVETFSNFVFFGSAYGITTAAINHLLVTYPINNTSATATDYQFELAQKFILTYSSFEKAILDGLSGTVSGTYQATDYVLKNIQRDVDNTLTSTADQNYIDGLLSEALLYDEQNRNLLSNFVPSNLIEFDTDGLLKNVVDVWGHIFDEILQYTTNFSNITNVTYDDYDRPRDIDVFNLLNLFGFKSHTTYMFSSLISYLLDFDETVQISERAIQSEIWNRILNNLIYIYKTKGTLESINAFLNCLGINSDIIELKEYVKFDRPSYIDVSRSVNYFDLSFTPNTATDSTSYISSSSNNFNLSSNDWSIVCNFDLKGTIKTQYLFGRSDQFSLRFINTTTANEYNEQFIKGYVEFNVVDSLSGAFSITTNEGNIFTNGIQTVSIVKNSSLSSYTIDLTKIVDGGFLESLSGTYNQNVSLTSCNDRVFQLGRTWDTSSSSFCGSIVNLKMFNAAINSTQIEYFTRNINTINLIQNELNTNVLVNWELNEPLSNIYRNAGYSLTSNTGGNTERIILDSGNGITSGSASGYSYFPNGNHYLVNTYNFVEKRYVQGLVPYNDKINVYQSQYKNTKYISLDISPYKALNKTFEYLFGPIDFLDYFLNIDLSNDTNKYSGLEALKTQFFNTGVSVRDINSLIVDIDKYASGLFKLFYQFIPAGAILKYKGLIIEQPVFDRNKHIIRNLELDTVSNLENQEILSSELQYEKILEKPSLNIESSSLSGNAISNIDSLIETAEVDGKAIPELDTLIDHQFDINQDTSAKNTNDYITTDDLNFNYFRYKDNTLSAPNNNLNLLSPVSVNFGGLIDMDGYTNIFLDETMLGEIDLIVKYKDVQGDNIIGSVVEFTQATNLNKQMFTIVNLDDSVTSSSLRNIFYLVDYDGANIKLKFNGLKKDKIELIENSIKINNDVFSFPIKVYWTIDSKYLIANMDITDTANIVNYPYLYWNILNGNSLGYNMVVDSATSVYGASLSATIYSNTASVISVNTGGSAPSTGTYIIYNNSNENAMLNILCTFINSASAYFKDSTMTGSITSLLLNKQIDPYGEYRFQLGWGVSGGDVYFGNMSILTNQKIGNNYKSFALYFNQSGAV